MKWLLRDAERLKEREEEESDARSPSLDDFDLCQRDPARPFPGSVMPRILRYCFCWCRLCVGHWCQCHWATTEQVQPDREQTAK